MFLKSHKRTPSGRNRIDITLNVEKMTSEERLSRQLHTSVRRSPNSEMNHLFEWFLVIGTERRVSQPDMSASEYHVTPPTPKQQSFSPATSPTTSAFRFLTRSPPPPPKESRIEYDTPKILYQYPPDRSLGAINVQDFPFPSGVPLSYQSMSESNTNLFSLLCSQSHLKEPSDSFVFRLTDEKNDVLYGVCTFKSSEVGLKIDDIDLHEDSLFQNSDTIITAPRCYVILTKCPFFPLHFNILNSVLKIQHMQQVEQFQNYLGSIRKPTPTRLADKQQIHQAVKKNENQMQPSISITLSATDSPRSASPSFSSPALSSPAYSSVLSSPPTTPPMSTSPLSSTLQVISPAKAPDRPIRDLIEYFYHQSIPKSGENLKYQIDVLDRTIEFRREVLLHKESDFAGYVNEYGLLISLQLLSPAAITSILNSILLERKIVFYSKSLRNLTSVIFTMSSLIKPFIYQSVLLPIVPDSLRDVCSAPVPFIVGTSSKSLIDEVDLKEVIVVDIDLNKIIHKGPSDILFPYSNDIANMLIDANKSLRMFMENKNQYNYSPTEAQEPVLNLLVSNIQKHFEALFENFNRHCVRDVSQLKHVSVFVKETFIDIEYQEEAMRNWFNQFFLTQMFSVYQDKKLRQSDGDEELSASSDSITQ